MSSASTPSSLNEALDQIKHATPAPVTAVLQHGIDQIRASGVSPGLEVGDRTPDFTLPDQLGREVRLSDRLAQGPVVLVFYRGEWCPYCNLTLKALQDKLDEIEAAGATLIAVGPQAPDHALSLTEKHNLRFSVLSDVTQETIRAYQLQFTLPPDNQELFLNTFGNDLRQENADGSWSLPVPGAFIIGRDGTIRARFVDADYRARMEPAEILAALSDV
jgi:peroxiredoxin